MIVIEDYTLQNAKVSEEQLRMEIAALLYERETCSLRKAARIVGVDWMELQKFLGTKDISVYTEEMLDRDLEFAKNFRK
jgi:predicted HTH domain antitoxin